MEYTNVQLNAIAKDINLGVNVDTIANETTFLDKLKEFWPLVKPLLEAAKIITGPKVDEIIDKIIEIIDILVGNVSGDKKAKIKEFCNYWPLVRMPLNAVASLMSGKKGKAFKQFIKMADIFCEQYE